jgi:hypothetical protein
MNKQTPRWMFPFILVITASMMMMCNAPATISMDSVPAQPTPEPSTPTEAQAMPDPVEAEAVESGGPDLVVRQMLLRFDGLSGEGTFEATICNLGTVASPPFEVQFTVNGVTAGTKSQQDLPANFCRGYFVPEMNFASFNVTQPGVVDVNVTLLPGSTADPVENNSYVEQVRIDKLDTTPPAEELTAYQECLTYSIHAECSTLLKVDPVADPHEIKKQSGDYIAIFPAAYEFLGNSMIADNQLCVPSLENYLGVPHPAPVTERGVVADYVGGYTAFGSAIYVSGPLSDFEYYGQPDTLAWTWSSILKGKCSNIHELTHWFMGFTPMSGWLEEGLATVVQDENRTNFHSHLSIECREDGWYGTNMDGVDGLFPFQDLTVYDENVPGIYYYYSAACFWVYVEESYGADAVRQIVQQSVAQRVPPEESFCTGDDPDVYFIRDIVNPVVGEDVSPVTEARWGFGSTYSGCD